MVEGTVDGMETENTLTVTINLDGDAIATDPGELPRILRLLADRIEVLGSGASDYPLRDVNGNTVGRVDWPDITDDEDGELDDPEGCEGHESLAGEHMGETVYCDGSCQ